MEKGAGPTGHPEPQERSLIEAARLGETGAFGQLVTRYMEKAYYAALFYLRNHEDARDISQEAFARAYKNLHRFDLERPFYPWFLRILRNLCINHLRKQKRRGYSVPLDSDPEEPGMDLPDSAPNPSAVAQESEILEIFWREVSQLKPSFREILILRHRQDLSYQQIAEALEVPIGTVMSRLNAARKELRERLKETDFE